MITEILVLVVIAFGFCILIGGGKTGKFSKFLMWLIVAPLLLAVGFYRSFCLLYGAPFLVQISAVLLVPFFVSALLQVVFPKVKWLGTLQLLIFQTLIYAAIFPFRFLWRAGKFFVRKERQKSRLAPHRAFVGERPPLIKHREESKNQNNLFDE